MYEKKKLNVVKVGIGKYWVRSEGVNDAYFHVVHFHHHHSFSICSDIRFALLAVAGLSSFPSNSNVSYCISWKISLSCLALDVDVIRRSTVDIVKRKEFFRYRNSHSNECIALDYHSTLAQFLCLSCEFCWLLFFFHLTEMWQMNEAQIVTTSSRARDKKSWRFHCLSFEFPSHKQLHYKHFTVFAPIVKQWKVTHNHKQ